MTKRNEKIDLYLKDGCGRCSFYATPQCKVHDWRSELKQLRSIVLDCDLNEELKWGVPCYTYEKNNVLIIAALRDHCSLSFFKGALLKDEKGILQKPGENSQAARLVKFTSKQQVLELKDVLQTYIREAIEVEKAGLKIEFTAKSELVFPDELQKKFDELPALRTAFMALTPGRQRGYVLHFCGAKQSKTRETRIEKCIPRILEGLGMHD